MKNVIKTKLLLVAIFFSIATTLTFCTKHDQVLDLSTPTASIDANATVLTSVYTNSPPTFIEQLQSGTWNGSDAVFSNAPKLTVAAIVPDATMMSSNNFLGFLGNSTNVTMRSMYDANNVYFLVEWNCYPDIQSLWWYYDPSVNAWAQESSAPVIDANGNVTRLGFTQDRFAMIFNVDSSCYAFKTQGCYGVCHRDVPDASGVLQSFMHTNGAMEKLDLWWADMITAKKYNQMSDGFEDYAGGVLYNDGRNTDNQLAATPVAFDNISTNSVKIIGSNTGTSADTCFNLPMYAYPTSKAIANANAMFLSDTVAGGAAVAVTGIDTAGILYLADGSTIKPNANYQRNGSGVGQYCIPGSFFTPFQGSRADITCNIFNTGTGWKLLIKRALKTGDVNKQDVNLSNLVDQPFGIGVFFNHADNQHAIVSGLTLKFQK